MSKIEGLSSLNEDTPSDVTTTILHRKEEEEVLPLLERPVGISIAEMRKIYSRQVQNL